MDAVPDEILVQIFRAHYVLCLGRPPQSERKFVKVKSVDGVVAREPVSARPLPRRPRTVLRAAASLARLAGVCRSWRAVVSDVMARDMREISLPGEISCFRAVAREETVRACVNVGYLSIFPPPQDNGRFLERLESMRLAPERFASVRRVSFANYELCNASLAIIAQLFPMLEVLRLDGLSFTDLAPLAKLKNLRVRHCVCV